MTDTRAHVPETGAGWGWILLYGIVSVIVGVLAFAWPFAATYAATVVIGAFFLVSGVVSIAAGIMGRGSQTRWYAILLGVVSVFAGLVLWFEPLTGALSLTLLVVAWLLVRGALELVWGFRHRRMRGWMIALGVLNVPIALFVLGTVPWSALTLPGYILGASFLFGGVTGIMAGLDHRRGAAAFAVPA
jgi:uncharacterized membrane protein HdeD (DUF308 family)